MSKLEKKQGHKPNSPEGKFFRALQPIKDTKVVRKILEILKNPETKMPSGINADTEKFILGLSISVCLFSDKNNKKILLEKGEPLLQYTSDLAKKVPAKQAPLVIEKFNELISGNTRKKS